MVGTNADGSYNNFGFKKATAKNSIPKAHTILLGTSGAGKTVAANEILKQLLGYDYENQILHHLNETNHVIFDIKDSFYHQVKKLKEQFPDNVDINDFDKNEFMYNIVDCEVFIEKGKRQVDESDLDFSATLISLILSSSGGNTDEALSSSEAEEYKSGMRGRKETEYKKIKTVGYSEFIPFDQIKEKEFDKFKKPLIHNVINQLKQRETNYRIRNRDMEERLAQSLIYKLETIAKMQIFSSFSKLNFKKKEIIYFRTDSIVGGSDYGYLVFAMQSILAKQIKKSQHKKRLEYKGPKDKQYRPLVFFW